MTDVPITHYVSFSMIEARAAYGRVPTDLPAVCGTVIARRDSTTTPTCQACAEWLRTDDADTRAIAEGLGLEVVGDFLLPKVNHGKR